MTEELPALWALDMAAKAAGYRDWSDFLGAWWRDSDTTWKATIAHARTLERLAKHEPDIVPVDEDEEAFQELLETLGLRPDDTTPQQYAAALAQFKAELAGRK